ncbi:hypothetical protein [Serinibacter arcticus]|uniref:hypothetical protein n=1 Tax=Serinibacter arcticus TaxID=1655435 RepID=UPI0018EE9377|nr:hypothetical protein [Serinibacter arcticus]
MTDHDGDATGRSHGSEVAGRRRPAALLRWGLPRDHRAMEHVVTFVVIALATILVTRLFLIVTGYPQVGGDGLHIAHVLWGGALMVVAFVLLLLFIGPVVRPAAVLVGGIGFGLFIDEVGKFLTDDNDYFYEPAFAIMYASAVAIVVAADLVASRRRRTPAEDVAAATDIAVTGLVGGLSVRQRAAAEELLERAGDRAEGPGSASRAESAVAGAAEVRALLAALPADDDELPDPVRALTHRTADAARRVVSEANGWRIALWGSAVLLLASTVVAVTDVSAALASGVAFLIVVSGLSLVASWALWFLAWRAQRSDDGGATARRRALDLLRGAVAVNLLLTQVALFRFDPWQATVLVVVGMVLLVVLWAEQQRRHAATPGA